MAKMKKPRRIKVVHLNRDPVSIPVKVYSLTEEDMKQIEELLRKGK